MQAFGGPARQKILDRLSVVNGSSIPDDEQLALDLAQQEAEEADHVCAVIRRGLGLHVHASVSREGTDRRAMIPRQGDAEHRCLLAARPGPHVVGQQIEPGLVYPDDEALLVGGFFLSAGQRCCHQP